MRFEPRAAANSAFNLSSLLYLQKPLIVFLFLLWFFDKSASGCFSRFRKFFYFAISATFPEMKDFAKSWPQLISQFSAFEGGNEGSRQTQVEQSSLKFLFDAEIFVGKSRISWCKRYYCWGTSRFVNPYWNLRCQISILERVKRN